MNSKACICFKRTRTIRYFLRTMNQQAYRQWNRVLTNKSCPAPTQWNTISLYLGDTLARAILPEGVALDKVEDLLFIEILELPLLQQNSTSDDNRQHAMSRTTLSAWQEIVVSEELPQENCFQTLVHLPTTPFGLRGVGFRHHPIEEAMMACETKALKSACKTREMVALRQFSAGSKCFLDKRGRQNASGEAKHNLVITTTNLTITWYVLSRTTSEIQILSCK